MYKLQKH